MTQSLKRKQGFYMSSLGSAVAGNNYQVRVFWYHAVQLLYEKSLERVDLESSSVKVIDDVVCVYKKPRPIRTTGKTYTSEYFQVKYHVDKSNVIKSEDLIDESKVHTKDSMLVRFFNAYKKLSNSGSSKLSLVTNWAWDPNDPLARCFRHSTFEKKYATNQAALEMLKKWQNKLSANDDEFDDFVSRLSLTQWYESEQQNIILNDRLRNAGLKPIDNETNTSPYDSLGLARRFPHLSGVYNLI